MRKFPFLACCLLAACGNQQQESAPSSAAAPAAPQREPIKPTRDGHFSPAITAEDFAAYVQHLASDEFEGRKPGTIGERTTTTWLIEQFQSMGLKPGAGDSYLQNVPAIETTLPDGDKVTLDVAAGGKVDKYKFRDDMIVGTLQGKGDVTLADSDVVFAGYGVVAPEYQWNDYAGLDVKGKTVVVLINDPGFGNGDETLFKGKAMTYYGRWTYKFEEAARQGAAAAFIVHDTEAAGYPWRAVEQNWSVPRLNLPKEEDDQRRLPVAGWLSTDAARQLFAHAGADFDAMKRQAALRGFTAVPLQATMSVAFDSTISHGESHNVVARLNGNKHADEAIVYSAHWDHEAGAGDAHRGSVDNATGVSGLLEIAEAFAHRAPKPHRSLLFLATTLDESGLLGSRYYVKHPVVPLTRTVADINLDLLPVDGPASALAVIGFGQSQMDDYLADAAHVQHRAVTPDIAPEKGFFFRSDQLSFARAGVPVLYARSAATQPDATPNGGDVLTADDSFNPRWNLSGAVEDTRALFIVGSRLSMEESFPQWKPGSDYRRPDSMQGL